MRLDSCRIGFDSRRIGLKAKVSIALKKKSYVQKPLRSNSLLSIQSKLPLADIGDEDRPYGFLSRGAFMPAKKPGIKFD